MDWISVKDRLPDNNNDMLVCNFMDGTWADYTVAWYGNNGWSPQCDMLEASNHDGGAHIQLSEEVTHWMPLPDAPQESNEQILNNNQHTKA